MDNYQGKLQQPLGSGFDRNSTGEEVIKGIDLTGKLAIVTGGHSGLGLETTKLLASVGATVIVLARDTEKAKNNLGNIDNVSIEPLEITNPASIEAFASKFLAEEKPLHLLFNNAGIMWTPLQRDARGYESQFSTNHLGHFHLTAKLWPALKQAQGARVINTSSSGHHASPVIFEDPNFEKREYDEMIAYGQSKTANILFALELDNLGKQFGIRSYSLHPGLILTTDLGRYMTPNVMKKLGMLDENGNFIHREFPGAKTARQGVSTHLWCATSPLLNDLGGVYCEDTEVAVLDSATPKDVTALKGVRPYALDEASAKKLWTLSEQLTGVKFSI